MNRLPWTNGLYVTKREEKTDNIIFHGYFICMKNKKLSHEFDYYVLLFFSLAFAGWLWEVTLYFFTEHAFINRGVYRGPYLPVYGVGGLLLYVFFHSFRKKPLRVFWLSALFCSILEYLTSYFLERRWGVRWWDYGNHLFNISGRICLTGALLFGGGGVALVCLFIPFYEKMYWKIPKKGRIWICFLLLALFVADGCYCAMRPNVGYGISSR